MNSYTKKSLSDYSTIYAISTKVSELANININSFNNDNNMQIDLTRFSGWQGKTKDNFSNLIVELNSKLSDMKIAYEAVGEKIGKCQELNTLIEKLKSLITKYNEYVNEYSIASAKELAIAKVKEEEEFKKIDERNRRIASGEIEYEGNW